MQRWSEIAQRMWDVCDIDGCSQFSGHTYRREGVERYLCCEHHVANGGAPSNWHPECLQAYAKAKGADPIEYADEIARREAGILAGRRLS